MRFGKVREPEDGRCLPDAQLPSLKPASNACYLSPNSILISPFRTKTTWRKSNDQPVGDDPGIPKGHPSVSAKNAFEAIKKANRSQKIKEGTSSDILQLAGAGKRKVVKRRKPVRVGPDMVVIEKPSPCDCPSGEGTNCFDGRLEGGEGRD